MIWVFRYARTTSAGMGKMRMMRNCKGRIVTQSGVSSITAIVTKRMGK